jgi:hypothetical protein
VIYDEAFIVVAECHISLLSNRKMLMHSLVFGLLKSALLTNDDTTPITGLLNFSA